MKCSFKKIILSPIEGFKNIFLYKRKIISGYVNSLQEYVLIRTKHIKDMEKICYTLYYKYFDRFDLNKSYYKLYFRKIPT